jgi:phage terminase small subunit
MTELTFKQKQFCEFYVGSGNASEAARLAGYSAKSAYATGHENLKKHEVVEYIKSLNQAMSSTRIASALERQEFWTAIMRGQMPEIESIQLKASEILGRAQGDFIQKVDVSGNLALESMTDEQLDQRIQELMHVINI